jgi:hypothetical protein
MHLHHLTPRPAGYGYLYPDFLWAVYMSEAIHVDDSRRETDDYEEEVVFRLPAQARGLDLSSHSRVFLEAALART